MGKQNRNNCGDFDSGLSEGMDKIMMEIVEIKTVFTIHVYHMSMDIATKENQQKKAYGNSSEFFKWENLIIG